MKQGAASGRQIISLATGGALWPQSRTPEPPLIAEGRPKTKRRAGFPRRMVAREIQLTEGFNPNPATGRTPFVCG